MCGSKRNFLRIHQFIAAALLAPALVQAAVVYTTESSFTDQLVAGFYLEDFSGLTAGNQNQQSMNFSGGSGTFDYTISAAGAGNNLFVVSGPGMPSGNAMSTTIDSSDLVITFTSGNVTAVGAHVFISDLANNQVAGTFTVTLSDGTMESVTSGATPFRGFTTTAGNPITTLTLSGFGGNQYPTVDNVYAGTAVPEPSTYGLAAVLFLVVVSVLHRRRARQQA